MKTDFKRIKDYYDNQYYQNKKRAGHTYLPWHYKFIARKLEPIKDSRVLDVACGTGEWLSLMNKLGATPSGIDISSKAIEECKTKFSNKEDFYVVEAENLPFEDDKFDVVTCLGSMEHFLDPVQSVKEMVRVAKPDATFVILVPNTGFLTMRLGLYKGTDQAGVKEDVRSLEEWQKLFDEGGIEVRNRYRDLHILDKKWITKDGLLKAPLRFLIAAALPILPISWQYQVYHFCKIKI